MKRVNPIHTGTGRILAFLVILLIIGCGHNEGDLKDVVRDYAENAGHSANPVVRMDVSVTNLSTSIDGERAVVTGVLCAVKTHGAQAGQGPFSPFRGSSTTVKFRASCRRFDTGWKVESFDY